MLVNIDRLEIQSFKPHESIDYWYKCGTSKHRDGKARAHGNTWHVKPGLKPKQTKLTNRLRQDRPRLHGIFFTL